MRSVPPLLLLTLLAAGPARADNVSLQVDAVPAQSLIFIDREVRGQGHVELQLPAGPHLLRVSAGDSWETYQVDLSLTTPQALKIQLKPSGIQRILDARHEMQAGHYDQARELLLTARATAPVSGNWWLGICEFNSSRPTAALAAFRAYAQYVADWPELYLFLGNLREREGNAGEAVTAYKTALLKRDGWGDALTGLEAPTQANIDALGQPTDAREQLRLAQLLMLKGQMPAALAEVKQAIAQVYGDWEHRDWLTVEPKLIPEPTQPPPAAPEDTQQP